MNFFLLGYIAFTVTVILVMKIIVFLHVVGRLKVLEEHVFALRRLSRELARDAGDVTKIIPAVTETRDAVPDVKSRLEEIKSIVQQDKFPSPLPDPSARPLAAQ